MRTVMRTLLLTVQPGLPHIVAQEEAAMLQPPVVVSGVVGYAVGSIFAPVVGPAGHQLIFPSVHSIGHFIKTGYLQLSWAGSKSYENTKN